MFLFLFQTLHRFLHKKHIIIICLAISLNIFFRKFISWERKGNFKKQIGLFCMHPSIQSGYLVQWCWNSGRWLQTSRESTITNRLLLALFTHTWPLQYISFPTKYINNAVSLEGQKIKPAIKLIIVTFLCSLYTFYAVRS